MGRSTSHPSREEGRVRGNGWARILDGGEEDRVGIYRP